MNKPDLPDADSKKLVEAGDGRLVPPLDEAVVGENLVVSEGLIVSGVHRDVHKLRKHK